MEGVLEGVRVHGHGQRNARRHVAHHLLHRGLGLGGDRGHDLLHVGFHGRLQGCGDLRRHLLLQGVGVDDLRRVLPHNGLQLGALGVGLQRRLRQRLEVRRRARRRGLGIGGAEGLGVAGQRRAHHLAHGVAVEGGGHIQVQRTCIEPGHRRQIARRHPLAQRARVHVQLRLIELEGVLQRLLVDAEQVLHREIRARFLFLGELLAVEHVDGRVIQLLLHDGGLGGLLDQMARQLGRVVDAHRKRRGLRVRSRLHNADDLQLLAGVHEPLHVLLVAGFVDPDLVLLVIGVEVGGGHHLQRHAHDVVVGEGEVVVGAFHVFLVHKLVDHILQHRMVAQAQRVAHQIGNRAVRRQHDDALVVGGRPPARLHVVLLFHNGGVAHHLAEHIGGVHGRHERVGRTGAHTEGGERRVRIDLAHPVLGVAVEDLGHHVVGVLDGVHVAVDVAAVLVEEQLERGEVVVLQACEHIGDHARLGHVAVGGRVVLVPVLATLKAHFRKRVVAGALARRISPVARAPIGGHAHERRHVEARGHDLQRVHRQRLLLGALDVVVHAVGEREYGRNADDADGAGEGRHDGAALLGHKVVRRQRERRGKAHRGLADGLARGVHLLFRGEVGIGIRADDAVGEVHRARGVLGRQLRVVGDHDDQAILGDLREQVHDLHGSMGIQGAGGLVGQHDLRVVDERAGNGHPLHLAARELARLLVQVLGQAHGCQGLLGAARALGLPHARERQRQLHVLQDGLVRNEIVALEHEPDAVVAEGVPVAILVAVGGDAVDDHVAGVVVIQAAHHVQKRRLARARRAQNRHELVVAERDGDVVQGHLGEVARRVGLADILELQHARIPFPSILGSHYEGAAVRAAWRFR